MNVAWHLRLLRAARWLAPRVPLPLSYWLAERAGTLLWLRRGSARANVEHNQRRALGPDTPPRVVALTSRAVLRNLAKVYVDEFRTPALEPDALRRVVKIHGLEHLEQAHAQGRGVILVSAHLGAPHLVGHLLAVLGYPTTVVAEHVQPEEVFQFMCAMRRTHGVRILAIDQPLLGLVRTLRKEQGVVGLVVDRDVSGTGLRMPFLGEETSVADGPVQLALSTGAPLITAFCRRLPGGRYETFVEPPLPLPQKPADRAAAIRDGTAQLMARLERAIRADPSQWLMTVPLWPETNVERRT